MRLEDIRSYCLSLPGTTEDIKWGNDLVFSIAGKMYAATGIENVPVSLSFKASEEEFEELSGKNNFKPAPYLARAKWVLLEDTSREKRSEVEGFLKNSYCLVRSRLSKKLQNQLPLV